MVKQHNSVFLMGIVLGLILLCAASAFAQPMFSVKNVPGTIEYMRVHSNGYVGIGIAAPTYPLHISQSGTTAAAMIAPGTWAGGSFATWYFGDTNHFIRGTNGTGMTIRDFDNIIFSTAAGPIERMRIIGTNGFVGINTPAPGYMLDVNGQARHGGNIYPNVTGANGQFLQTNGAGTLSWATVTATNYWTSAGGNIYNNTGTNVGIGNAAPAYLLDVNGQARLGGNLYPNVFGANGQFLQTNGAGTLSWGTATNYWSINGANIYNSTGTNVGIGTNTPVQKLEVISQANSGIGIYNTTDLKRWVLAYDENEIDADGGDYFYIDEYGNTRWLVIKNITGNVGLSTYFPTQKLQLGDNGAENCRGLAAAWDVFSDARWKTNVATMENPLANVLQLRGVTFNWKESGVPSFGFIAQEIEQVFPLAVTTDDKGFKSVNYGQMSAVLVEAVKELNAKVEALEQENATLQAKVDKIAQMEQELQIIKTSLLKQATQPEVKKTSF